MQRVQRRPATVGLILTFSICSSWLSYIFFFFSAASAAAAAQQQGDVGRKLLAALPHACVLGHSTLVITPRHTQGPPTPLVLLLREFSCPLQLLRDFLLQQVALLCQQLLRLQVATSPLSLPCTRSTSSGWCVAVTPPSAYLPELLDRVYRRRRAPLRNLHRLGRLIAATK